MRRSWRRTLRVSLFSKTKIDYVWPWNDPLNVVEFKQSVRFFSWTHFFNPTEPENVLKTNGQTTNIRVCKADTRRLKAISELLQSVERKL